MDPSDNGHFQPAIEPPAHRDVASGAPGDEVGLKAFLGLIRRRWLLILLPLIAVPAVAVALSANQEKRYTASATMLFQDSRGTQLASNDPTREAATNVRLLEVGVVKDRVDRRLGQKLADTTTGVAPEGDSNLVTVKTVGPTPERAALAANAFANEFIKVRQGLSLQTIRTQQAQVRRGIARADRKDAITLTRRLRQLKLSEATVAPDVSVVRAATPPSSASSPKPLRNGVIGLFAGLLLGLGLAALRDRLDLRVRDPRFFEQAVGRPILARIPRSRALHRPPGSVLPAVEEQAFYNLRANLDWAMNGNRRSIMVTSAEAGEGKTTVAWNLACAVARTPMQVLLIEGDLRRPALSSRLGAAEAQGLTEVLSGRAEASQVIRQVPLPHSTPTDSARAPMVDVLFAGAAVSDPTALFQSQAMTTILEELVARYDLVVIDTPPTSIASDVVPLVSQVGGVLVITRLAKSRSSSIVEFSDLMRRLHAPTLGVVVNSSELPRETYRYHYAGRV